MRKSNYPWNKEHDPLFENVKKAPFVFAILFAISVASYALTTPLMVKNITFNSVSALSLLGMMLAALSGALVSDFVGKKLKNKVAGFTVGILFASVGIAMLILEMSDVVHLPGPLIEANLTGDSLFFIFTYVLSDVFSEVFGYKASRISANTSAIFALFVSLICKGMTLIPGPDWATDNDFSFSFIYGGGIYVTILGILIYAIGDWANDITYRWIREKTGGSSFSAYSLRSIGSSIIGKSVDLTLFSVLVFVPLSTDWICDKLGIVSWGMTADAIKGNYVLGIALQITMEVIFAPIAYFISSAVLNTVRKPQNLNS